MAAASFPTAAQAGVEDRVALTAYVQARMAGSLGASEEAARAYAAALALSPDNEMLATRAFTEALEAGNRPLALGAARALERAGPPSTDVRLLLLSEALRTRDWKRASAEVEAVGKDPIFGFIAPVIRAWIAADRSKGDPLAVLDAGKANPLTNAYAEEHRPFLLLASRRQQAGLEALKALAGDGNGLREQRLKIAGAATLAGKGKRRQALELLAGDAPSLVAARALLSAGKPLPGGIGTAAEGMGQLMVRIAGDLHRQNAPFVALRFARLATFLSPGSSESWVVASDLLGAAERNDAALAALAEVKAGDPFAPLVSAARIRLLVAGDREQLALDEAAAAAKANPSVASWSLLGDLLSQLERRTEAAEAYRQALALVPAGDGNAAWILHLLRGGALEEAGNWPEAKAALAAAHELAPQEPIVLNYLGYAQLERRENIDEAMKLIAEASRLQPESAEITDSLGWAHYLQGDLTKAIELLERAAAGQPFDPEINEHLGDAYYKAGRRYEARYAWKAALVYAEEADAERLRAKVEAGLTPQLAAP